MGLLVRSDEPAHHRGCIIRARPGAGGPGASLVIIFFQCGLVGTYALAFGEDEGDKTLKVRDTLFAWHMSLEP